MIKIVAISGSLRAGSFNTALLKAAKRCVPADAKMAIASIADIPLYNNDDEILNGIPASVASLKAQIAAADGLLISTPEYNHGIPGVLKNALDWLTRPTEDVQRIFSDRKVGLIGASPSRLGTAFAQTAWLPILRYLNTRTYFGSQLFISSAHTAFNEAGELADTDVKKLLQAYIDGFFEFIKN